MISEELKRRALPPVWEQDKCENWQDRRKEILALICRGEYGTPLPPPDEISFKVIEENPKYCAGKATYLKTLICMNFENENFEFPVYSVIPNKPGKHPFFVHINFRDSVPDRYMPSEEICDNGFAVLSFSYIDVSADDGDFTSGIAKALLNGKREIHDCGKIGLWAYAASRVMDYAENFKNLDLTRGSVAGHSRLGKTALLAGALDERFYCAFSNDSGCSGASLARKTQNETVSEICRKFPYWFCRKYSEYAKNENEMPFDQHFLAAIAPRKVYVASADEDTWADPVSEYLSCAAADEVYQKLGLTGFVHPDRLPIPGDTLHSGNIGYHLRAGTHYFSREDWLLFMQYLKSKR